jgi:antitoxin component YwqK of YwqJK toxin-antitoxin module
MKKYIFYLMPLLFIVSCTPKLEKVVEDTHPDGNPRLVVYYKMEDGFREKVKVEAFYEDGTQHYVGEFADQKRNGSWTYWYKNGNKWSDGYFKNDLRDGNGTTWHKNGQKNYDCSYTEGVRTGVWKFYDPEGNFLKEVNYEEE